MALTTLRYGANGNKCHRNIARLNGIEQSTRLVMVANNQTYANKSGAIFKIINGYYDLTVDTFLNLMMLEEEDIAKSYSREEALDIRKCVCKPNCGKMECFTRQLCDMYYIE